MTATGRAARSTKQTREIAEALAARARDGEHGKSIERIIETLTDDMRAAVDDLRSRVKALENKPEPLIPKQPANDLTAIPQAIGTIVERIEALEDRNDAGADLYEGVANALRMVADLSKMIQRNRARADGQHGMVVDELSHLANVIRRAG
jgi:ubiquinone biosynthesis protein UbiJ